MRSHLRIALWASWALVAESVATGAEAPPNRYIVSLKPGLDRRAVDSHIEWARDVHQKRGLSRRDIAGVEKSFGIGSFHAYTGTFDELTIAEIEANETVSRVEPDAYIQSFAEITTQPDATWGLGAISHSTPLAPNASLENGYEYRYDPRGGEGTWAYVLDGGVWVDNPDFEGRAELGYTVYPDIPFEDSEGHGTHVAGTIASRTWGVAKKARVVAVKVIAPNQGVFSQFMEGFEWAVNNITNTPGRAAVSVINMSLGGPVNYAFNDMVTAASNQGILSVISAGNAAGGLEVGRVSPASTPSAITVAASARNNTMWSNSNYGAGVDLYAPGVDIHSLSLEAGKAAVLSGTSMAAPHVAGLALYLKSVESGLESVEAVTARILELARVGVITEVKGETPNRLAFNGVAA